MSGFNEMLKIMLKVKKRIQSEKQRSNKMRFNMAEVLEFKITIVNILRALLEKPENMQE